MDELNIVNTQPTSSSVSLVGINHLPDEVLEYILSLLPPYKDLEQCKLVCKRWKKNVSNVIQYTKTKMLRSLANFDVKWENVQVQQSANPGKPTEQVQVITKRYSHSACFHENAMYVFGGCTCTSTTFNDLWKLDLSTRKWHRQLTTGSYPSPKACATLTYHDSSLLLFGGWTHPSPYPLHQAWRTFNELHIYDIVTNRWNPVTTPTNSPPPMAGHSATIHKDNMVIFGGLHGQNNGSSNDVWCFNLYAHVWTKQEISGIRPQSRYGQSQIVLDDNHLLILGGCSQGNMNLNDIWLLNMSEEVWTWRQVTVRNPQWAASHLWCHPACRVGHYVVVFSRNPVTLAPIFSYSKWRPSIQTRSLGNSFERDPTIPPAVRRASESMVEQHVIDRDVNVNGRRGSLSVRASQQSEMNQLIVENESLPSTSSSSSINPSEPSSSSATFSHLIENNAESVLNTSSDESTNQEIAASSSSSLRENLSHSSIRQSSSDSAKFDSSRNVSISNDRNSFNYNRFYSLSNNRRLEFLSPPHSSPGMAAFRDNSTVNTNTGKQRVRQLEALKRIEERLLNKSKEKNPPPAAAPSFPAPAPPAAPSSSSSGKREAKPQSPSAYVKLLSPKMAMFVLDISCVLTDECFVSWLPVKSIAEDSPDDMILYTLVPGNGELIMFGGIQKDAMSINQQAQSSVNITNIVSNSVHFITPPHSII